MALQREQQRKRAEDILQQGVELELMQEEMEEKVHKEEAKQWRAQRYERRTKEKEEQQEDETEEPEDLVVMAKKPTGSSRPKEPKTTNL